MAQNKNMPQGKHIAGKKISKHATEEFKGKSDYVFCPKGEAVYYRKSWHHIAKFFTNPPDSKRDKDVVFELCPAHDMEKKKQYEGEVIVRDVPDMFRDDLWGLVEGMGERAMRKDVLDRIFIMKWAKNQLTVTTSENQLAQKIGRKIKETFKKHIAEYMMRPKGGESDFVSVQVAFIKKLK
ncbi:MAG: hypothetical protein Q8R30_01850 [bacterium]|nr:hypothetical protein [bacterium]MDZ4286267.1 hypothetical protein [Candidatus Sungbacteria bacterium]